MCFNGRILVLFGIFSLEFLFFSCNNKNGDIQKPPIVNEQNENFATKKVYISTSNDTSSLVTNLNFLEAIGVIPLNDRVDGKYIRIWENCSLADTFKVLQIEEFNGIGNLKLILFTREWTEEMNAILYRKYSETSIFPKSGMDRFLVEQAKFSFDELKNSTYFNDWYSSFTDGGSLEIEVARKGFYRFLYYPFFSYNEPKYRELKGLKEFLSYIQEELGITFDCV